MFEGALPWEGEAHVGSSVGRLYLPSMEAWGGIQGPELDTSAGRGGRVNRSNAGPMSLQAG